MSEKVYQLTSEQIGVIQFDKPWFLIHVSNNDLTSKSTNQFYGTIADGVRHVAEIFEENIWNVWLTEPDGEAKINRLRDYLLTTWNEHGVESMKQAMYEQYGAPEFKTKTGRELIYDGYDFMSITIGHIALRWNKKHFFFEGLHVSTHVVEKFLCVNFWDKLKNDALAKIGTTVLK